MTDATGPPPKAVSIGDAALAVIKRATPLSMLGHLINVTLALIAFQNHVPRVPLMFWAAAAYGVGGWVLIRWASRRKFRRQPRTSLRVLVPRRAAIFGAAL